MRDVITGNWDLRSNLKQEIEKWLKWSKYVEEREKEKRKEGEQKETQDWGGRGGGRREGERKEDNFSWI